jgi:hypothetical protein
MTATIFTAQQIQALIKAGHGNLVREYNQRLTPLELFTPRPDNPEQFDEQTSFVKSRANFAICLGGNGSGKTVAAAYKTARYVLETPPFREHCPFWIIGQSFDMVCSICWQEKLTQFIPQHKIAHVSWHDKQRQWPAAVLLKHPKDPTKIGWILEFKSYNQGRQHMQGRSIGGYWFNEEVPIEIVEEVQWRCRDYGSPGWADFTPVEIVSPEWPDKYEDPPDGWEFYHLNTSLNQYIDQDYVQSRLKATDEDMRMTRETGHFATFRGQVFKEFRRGIHVLDPHSTTHPEPLRKLAEQLDAGKIPAGWTRIRGIDWGYNSPFAVVWVARDKDGTYYVYDEHYETQKPNAYHLARINLREWKYDHPAYGPTYCDTADPQQMVEFTRLGLKCTGANKGFGQYPVNSRISELRSLMLVGDNGRPRLYILSKCKNLISEIRGYHWAEPTGASTGDAARRQRNPQNRPVDFNDHAIDAMGYAIYSDKMGTGSAPKPVPRPWKPRESVQFQGPRRRA